MTRRTKDPRIALARLATRVGATVEHVDGGRRYRVPGHPCAGSAARTFACLARLARDAWGLSLDEIAQTCRLTRVPAQELAGHDELLLRAIVRRTHEEA
jgi:hypothetical protein